MFHRTMERLALFVLSAATLILLLSLLMVTPQARALMSREVARAAAAALLVLPMILFLVFTVAQALPHGRTRISVVRGSSDGWLLALVLLTIGPKGTLAELAGAPWGATERGLSISLVTGTLCVIARVVQLNLGARQPLA